MYTKWKSSNCNSIVSLENKDETIESLKRTIWRLEDELKIEKAKSQNAYNACLDCENKSFQSKELSNLREKYDILEKENILLREQLSDAKPNGWDLKYASLDDKFCEVSRILRLIEKEAHECAMCGGREDCGYSTNDFLKEVCYLLFQSAGYHRENGNR